MTRAIEKYLLFAAVILAVSCSKPDAEPVRDNNAIIFSFKNSSQEPVQQMGATTKTPADESYNENVTDRFDIFFYSGQTCVFYPTPVQTVVDNANSQVKIIIPDNIARDLLGNSYTIYVLANCNLDRNLLTGKTFNELRSIVYTNPADLNPTTFKPQANFLMEGTTSLTLTQGVNNLGHVELKRAAAKIILEIMEASVMGYTPGEATVTLKNYINKTALGSDVLYQSQSSDYLSSTRSVGDLSSQDRHVADPFYCYANDWESDSGKETYLLIKIPWTRNNDMTSRDYYYRIPFNYLGAAGDPDAHRFRIRRNYIYQFLIKANKLGGENPEDAVDLTSNFDVKEWNTMTIESSVLNYDFLVVYENEVNMYNITYRSIEYSSNSPVRIINPEAYCNEYSVSGTVSKKSYVLNSPEFPQLTIDRPNSAIDIVTLVPKNYVPRTLNFTVTNEAQIKQHVTVTIYPPKYITAQKAPDYPSGNIWAAGSNLGGGTNNPMGTSGQQNFNMFTVTTIVLSSGDRMPAGFPFLGMPITLGDPTEMITVNGVAVLQTKNDLNSNSVMSPKFVIASQRAISAYHTYDNAVLRCRGYQEYPYPRGSWRVPTAAELAYGNMLESDPESAVKGLFLAGDNSWWTAHPYYGFNFQFNDLTSLGTANTTYYIRCVHDVWRD